MPESLACPASVRIALDGIVDYAGLFPPAQLSMEDAVATYQRCRRGPFAWMLAKFVVRAQQLGALESALGKSEPVEAVAIADGQTPIHEREHVRLTSCEIALALPTNEIGSPRTAIRALEKGLQSLAPGLAVVVELPRGLRSTLLAEAMDALADARCDAKIRCGGVAAEATPSVAEVADFIRAATHDGVAFKATAGLHHPVRHFNAETGFVMHGFLNVLAAACAAPTCDTATLHEIVGEEDATQFAFEDVGFSWRGVRLADTEALAKVRRHAFRSFGSCSFDEPVDDLLALGVLPAR